MLDVLIGLRGRPSELAAAWKRASAKDRLGVLTTIVEDRSLVGDDALFRGLCKR